MNELNAKMLFYSFMPGGG